MNGDGREGLRDSQHFSLTILNLNSFCTSATAPSIVSRDSCQTLSSSRSDDDDGGRRQWSTKYWTATTFDNRRGAGAAAAHISLPLFFSFSCSSLSLFFSLSLSPPFHSVRRSQCPSSMPTPPPLKVGKTSAPYDSYEPNVLAPNLVLTL